MKQPTMIEEYIVYPLKRVKDAFVWWMITGELKKWGMDFGKYPIEELLKLYQKYEHEIDRL